MIVKTTFRSELPSVFSFQRFDNGLSPKYAMRRRFPSTTQPLNVRLNFPKSAICFDAIIGILK